MKILITYAEPSRYTDETAIGLVHLEGPIDTTACGLINELYDFKEVKRKKIDCPTCLTYLEWAKKVSKIKH